MLRSIEVNSPGNAYWPVSWHAVMSVVSVQGRQCRRRGTGERRESTPRQRVKWCLLTASNWLGKNGRTVVAALRPASLSTATDRRLSACLHEQTRAERVKACSRHVNRTPPCTAALEYTCSELAEHRASQFRCSQSSLDADARVQ